MSPNATGIDISQVHASEPAANTTTIEGAQPNRMEGSSAYFSFWYPSIALSPSRPAEKIEERAILEDEVLMRQIRPAMASLARGDFFSKLIPWKRTTKKTK